MIAFIGETCCVHNDNEKVITFWGEIVFTYRVFPVRWTRISFAWDSFFVVVVVFQTSLSDYHVFQTLASSCIMFVIRLICVM